MKHYTHIAGGILFFLLIGYLLNLNNVILGMLLAGWISVFPDIIDKLIGKHKGIGHSIFWVVPFVCITFINYFIGIALLTGFLSHLLFDSFTSNGSPLLYPISKTNFVCLRKVNRIKTDTYQEKGVFIFIIFLIVPLFLLTTEISSNHNLKLDQNLQFTTGETNVNSPKDYKNGAESKKEIYINLDLNSRNNKNVTIQKVNENITNIVVKDLESGE